MDMVYVGILDGADDVWGVRIPDAPGVHGGGATPEEAIQDAASALAEVAQMAAAKGMSLRAPRSWAALKADPTVAGTLAKDEMLVLIEMKHAIDLVALEV
jgi:predicted RNase H-like HicB family nuclease